MNKKGFTLIEMMVAVSIFVIVAFIVVSALLTMSYAYKKAQKMRLIMDNFNFALQSMSLDIREGTEYDLPSGCLTGVGKYSCMSFKTSNGPNVCYSLQEVSGKGSIRKCNPAGLADCPCVGGGSRLTSSDIDVDQLSFSLLPVFVDKKAVKIMIGGVVGEGTRASTTFFIQNSISQRNVD